MEDHEAQIQDLTQSREWIANIRAGLAKVKAKMASEPAFRPKGEEFARSVLSHAEKLRRLCSNIRDSVEYHELEGDYSVLIDEARELID